MALGVPFANVLHQDVIQRLAGSSTFERGRRYFEENRVTSIDRRDGGISARVRGSETYTVKIWVHLDSLAYSCSCPHGQDKAFCKHAVATALAFLDEGSRRSSGPTPAHVRPLDEHALTSALEAKSKEALIELLVEAAKDDVELRARILGNPFPTHR